MSVLSSFILARPLIFGMYWEYTIDEEDETKLCEGRSVSDNEDDDATPGVIVDPAAYSDTSY
jgi:hypothetical protein